jgi:CO/xanthine dehydrogenase FAD-binding subunit
MRWQQYQVMSSLADTIGLLAESGGRARVVAGGTDLMVQVERGRIVAPLPLLLDVSRLEELREITVEDGYLGIGGATTMTELAESPLVRRHAPALAEGAAAAASWQVRNVATVGGNVMNASPAADTLPPLAALGATAEMAGPAGRRRVNVADLASGPGRTQAGPDEVLARILVPLIAAGDGQAFLKLGRRQALSVSVVNVAAQVRLEGALVRQARVALGAVAATVVVSKAASEILEGKAPSADRLAQLEEALKAEVHPISDVRAGADYRRDMAGLFGRRAVEIAYERALGSLRGPEGEVRNG